MKSFCKQQGCPTADELVGLHHGGEQPGSEDLLQHLSICEFCAAEAELYRVHPPVEEDVAIEQMPQPLQELAEAILHKRSDPTPLYKLVDNSN